MLRRLSLALLVVCALGVVSVASASADDTIVRHFAQQYANAEFGGEVPFIISTRQVTGYRNFPEFEGYDPVGSFASLNLFGAPCLPQLSPVPDERLKATDALEYDADFDTAHLVATFTCLDFAGTEVAVDITWTAEGRKYIHGLRPSPVEGLGVAHVIEGFRESITATGTITFGGTTYVLEPTPVAQPNFVRYQARYVS